MMPDRMWRQQLFAILQSEDVFATYDGLKLQDLDDGQWAYLWMKTIGPDLARISPLFLLGMWTEARRRFTGKDRPKGRRSSPKKRAKPQWGRLWSGVKPPKKGKR